MNRGADLSGERRSRQSSGFSPGDGHEHRQGAGVPNQQLHLAGHRHLRALQGALAGGIVLQVDQAVLRFVGKFGEVPHRDRRLGLCPCRHGQETPQSGCVVLHVVADFSVTMFKPMPLQHACPGSEHKAEQGNDCYQPNRFVF
jgi:hypothetical protein